MLKQTNWGHWIDTSRYPIEVWVLSDSRTGIYQWEVKHYPTNIKYASSYAPSLECAYADAIAAIEQGAVGALGIPAVMCYNTIIVTEGTPGATLFRETERGTWVGFHAGRRIEVRTTDVHKVPHLTARCIYEAETMRKGD